MEQNSTPRLEVYSPDQLATRLGIPVRTVFALLRTRKLVGIRLGRKWRVLEADLLSFLEESRKRAVL